MAPHIASYYATVMTVPLTEAARLDELILPVWPV